MDLNRMLGALLGGAAQPPKRRRRSTRAPARPRSTEAQLGQALGSIAAAAVEALLKRAPAEAPVPPPPRMPAPSRAGRAAARERERPWGDNAPAEPRPTPAPPRPAPAAGRGPWAGAAARPAPPPPPEPEPGPSAEEVEALLLVRAMVAAAKADGTIDAAERRGIAGQLDAAGLSAEERDFVLADFDRPMTPEALAREATDAMLRARLYAAAVAAMGEITPPERTWLDRLAAALKLDRAAAAAIEERLAA